MFTFKGDGTSVKILFLIKTLWIYPRWKWCTSWVKPLGIPAITTLGFSTQPSVISGGHLSFLLNMWIELTRVWLLINPRTKWLTNFPWLNFNLIIGLFRGRTEFIWLCVIVTGIIEMIRRLNDQSMDSSEQSTQIRLTTWQKTRSLQGNRSGYKKITTFNANKAALVSCGIQSGNSYNVNGSVYAGFSRGFKLHRNSYGQTVIIVEIRCSHSRFDFHCRGTPIVFWFFQCIAKTWICNWWLD